MRFLPFILVASAAAAEPLATIFGRHVETRRVTKPYPTFTVHEPVFFGVCCPIDEPVSGVAIGYLCDECLSVTYFSSSTRPSGVDELLRDFIVLPHRRHWA